MSETLRDLVVSLSLQTDNFTRNIRSVNKQIQEAESFFKAAGAGVDNFEHTTQGLSARLDMLKQRLTLQNQVMEQYQRALEAARAKLTECHTRQGEYAQRLEEATNRHAALREQVAQAAEAYRDCANRLGESDQATLGAAAHLEQLRSQYQQSGEDVKRLAGQCEALRKSTLNAADAVSTGNVNLNRASAAVKTTEADIDKCNRELALAQTSWNAAGESIRASQTAITSAGAQIQRADAMFRDLTVGIQNTAGSTEYLNARAENLNTRYELQNRALQEYRNVLAAANQQLAAAQQLNDPALIQQATDAVTRAETAVYGASAALKQTERDIEANQQALTLANSGWFEAGQAMRDSQNAVSSLGKQMQLAESEFRLATADITNVGSSAEGLNAKLAMLQERWRLQQEVVTQCEVAVRAAQQQLDAATAAGDPEKIREASDALTDAQSALNNARAALGGTRQEIDACNRDLTLANSGWYDAEKAVNQAQAAVVNMGKQLQVADSKVRLAVAGVTDLKTNVTALREKLSALQEKYALQSEAVEKYSEALDAAREQLEAAQQANDPEKIEEATNAVLDAEAALNQAEAALRETRQEVEQTGRELRTAASGWTHLGQTLTGLSQELEGFGKVASKAGQMLSAGMTTPVVALGAAALKSSIEFESGFTGVRKTVDASEAEFAQLSQSLKQMSTQVAASTSEISDVMATGGQLGIATENLSSFTKVMIDLGNCCENLDADEAATALAKFANIMGTDQKKFENIGSTLVDLGNNYATTESAIMEMSKRLAGAGRQVGMSEAQIMGFAAALSSVGIEAQMGGSAFSKALVKMEVAAEMGGQSLEDFATVCGMSGEEFKRLWDSDPAAAFQAFIVGLSKMDEAGESAIVTLNEIGINEIRLRDTMLRAVNATELFSATQETANKAWKENTALSVEANKRYATTESKLKNLENKAKLFAQQLGDDLNPLVGELVSGAGELIDQLMELDEGERMQLIRIAAIVAATGPALLIFGKVTQGVGKVTGVIGKFATAVGQAGGGVRGFLQTVSSSTLAMSALTAAVIYGGYNLYDYASGAKAVREALEGMCETAERWKNTAAETFYGNSNGLSAFGMSEDDFNRAAVDSKKWVDGVIAVWSDGEKETDEIVSTWTDSFKSLTENTRTELEHLKTAADESGYTSVSEQLAGDIEQLDSMDAEIERLLRKRQNGYFSDEDKIRLQELIDARDAIVVKYKLEPDDTEGFESIQKKVDAEIARAQARGQQDADVSIYEDAVVAAAEGLAAVNRQIDEQYDKEYEIIRLMEDADERTAALNALNEKYNTDRLAAAREYAETLASVVMPVWNQDDIQDADSAVDQLYAKLREYSIASNNGDSLGMAKALEDMEALTADMDEGALTEYVGLLTQIQSLLDSGMSPEEVQALFPEIDVSGQLSQLAELTQFIQDHKGTLEGLSGIFGEALPEEVLKIATDLDMTGAQERWNEFAANPGAITTQAVIDSYQESQEVQKIQPTVDALISTYTEVPEGASTAALTPAGLVAYVEKYAEVTTGADVSGITPDNITAMVAAYQELATGTDVSQLKPDEITAYISKYLEEAGVDTTGLTPDAITAFVVAYEEVTGGASTAALTPTDIAAIVTDYLLAENVDLSKVTEPQVDAIVSAYAEATGCDKSTLKAEVQAQITAYVDAEGVTKPSYIESHVSIVGYDLTAYNEFVKNNPVQVEGVVRLGEQFENPEDVLNDPNAKFYEGGQEIPVNLVPANKIDANTLIAYDEDGTMHVLITPEIQGTAEAVSKAGEALNNSYVTLSGPGGAQRADLGWLNDYMGSDLMGWISSLNGQLEAFQKNKGTWVYLWGLMDSGQLKGIESQVNQQFTGENLAGITTYISEMVAAIQNGEEVSADDLANLQEIVTFLNNLQLTGTGENVRAGIAQGMTEAGWDADAETVASELETALNTALGIASPAARMLPTGDNVAAGVSEGMTAHDFSSDASTLATNLIGAITAALTGENLTVLGTTAMMELALSMTGYSMAETGATIATNVRSAVSARLGSSTLRSIGLNAMSGLVAGINAGRASVVSAMRRAAQEAVNAAKSELQIHSPSAVFRDEVGRMTMKGFGQGALLESKAQAKTIRNAMRFMQETAQDSIVARGSSDNRRTYNQQSSVNLSGNTFYIRDEKDIRSLAIEIATLTRQQQRGRGLGLA